MILSAVIVMPSAGPGLPSYLFKSVAGLPLLIRQILGLRRAGISQVTILVDADKQAELAPELNRHQPLVGEVEIMSRWPEPPATGAPDLEAAYILLLPVNTLPGRRVYAALTDKLPPPGGLSLGVTPQSCSIPANLAEMPNLPRGWPTTGLGLFSTDAWQEWLDWCRQNGAEDCHAAAGCLASFGEFVAHQAAAGRVVTLPLAPGELIAVAGDDDLDEATERLIALENGSPLSEGILEKAWNRRLARLLLPRVLALPISPNQITIFSFLVGLLAVWGFAHGSYAATVAAGLLLPLILVLDCLDGAVARLKFQESPLGALLDIHGDSILNLLLFLGIVTGCYRNSRQPLFLILGLLIVVGYVACWRLVGPQPIRQPAAPQTAAGFASFGDKLLAEAVSRDFFYIILLMALLQRLDWLVIALAVGTNIFAWLTYRQQKNGQN